MILRLRPPTARQRELLALVAQGLPLKRIGYQLHRSPKTIANELLELRDRMNVRSNAEAIAVLTQSEVGIPTLVVTPKFPRRRHRRAVRSTL